MTRRSDSTSRGPTEGRGAEPSADAPQETEEQAGAPRGVDEGSSQVSGARRREGGDLMTHRPPGLPEIPKPAAVPLEASGLPIPPAIPSEIDVEISGLGPDESEARTGTKSSLPPPVLSFGRYAIRGRLAVGGMAEIYLAQETTGAGGSRHVVLKLVRPLLADDQGFDRMFVHEGRIAMRLVHPNICTVYEFGRADDRFFIAMEWIDGLTLRETCRLARERSQDPPLWFLVKLFSYVLEALEFAHRLRDEKGNTLSVVHRDVSPHNMMVRYDGVVKLLDFGVAKTAISQEGASESTVKGKFAYMSPEQCSGKHVDGRSDIFALGICMFEAFTGRSLYKRGTQYETFKSIIEGPVPSIREELPDFPETLDAIVRRALAKSPAQRYPTAAAMQHDLEKWLQDSREIVSSARMGAFMEEVFAREISSGPALERGEEALKRLTESLASLHTLPLDSELAARYRLVSEPADSQHDPLGDPSTVVDPIVPSRRSSGGIHLSRRTLAVLAASGLLLVVLLVVALWPTGESSESPPAPERTSTPSASTPAAPAQPPSPPAEPALPGDSAPAAVPAEARPEPLTPRSPAELRSTPSDSAGADSQPPSASERPDRGRTRRPGKRRPRRRPRGGGPGFVTDPGF